MINIRVMMVVYFFMTSCTVYATPIIKSISFHIYDADTNAEIPASVTIDGDKLKDGVFKLSADQDSRIVLNIMAETSEKKYHNRTITLFLEGLNVPKPFFKIYLASSQKEYIYSRGSVRKSAEFINNEFSDRAVALLERINAESPLTSFDTQFGVYLKYNLARAYINNCTQKFTNECSQGKDILLELNRNFDKYSKFLAAESISERDLENNTADNYYKRMEYLRAVWNISSGHSEEAIKSLDSLIDEVIQNPTLTSVLKRPLEGLKNDRALAEERFRTAPM